MELKTRVKVGEINNLSDARYCAGMGVDMIGFSMEANHIKYLSPAKIIEIANWLTGIKIVGEFDSMAIEQIVELSKMLPIDYLQLDYDTFDPEILQNIDASIILKVKVNENLGSLLQDFRKFEHNIKYFLLESDSEEFFDRKGLIDLCRNFKILLGFGVKKENMEFILNSIKPQGISLKGGIEIRPGLKDFQDLSEILEILEVDDVN